LLQSFYLLQSISNDKQKFTYLSIEWFFLSLEGIVGVFVEMN